MSTRSWLVTIVVGALVALAFFVPWRALVHVVKHRFSDDEGRSQALTVLRQGEHEVWLLGTTHDRLFDSERFSIWDVKRVLEAAEPKQVLAEILPADVDTNPGGGPVEMACVALWAKARGASVVGIDAHWRDGWGTRHNRMVEQVTHAVLSSSDKQLVVAGYGHVPSFVQALEAQGFGVVSVAQPDVFERSVQETVPDGYSEALKHAAELADNGTTPFRNDDDKTYYATVRRKIASRITADGHLR
jgi:hypothetical protein